MAYKFNSWKPFRFSFRRFLSIANSLCADCWCLFCHCSQCALDESRTLISVTFFELIWHFHLIFIFFRSRSLRVWSNFAVMVFTKFHAINLMNLRLLLYQYCISWIGIHSLFSLKHNRIHFKMLASFLFFMCKRVNRVSFSSEWLYFTKQLPHFTHRFVSLLLSFSTMMLFSISRHALHLLVYLFTIMACLCRSRQQFVVTHGLEPVTVFVEMLSNYLLNIEK